MGSGPLLSPCSWGQAPRVHRALCSGPGWESCRLLPWGPAGAETGPFRGSQQWSEQVHSLPLIFRTMKAKKVLLRLEGSWLVSNLTWPQKDVEPGPGEGWEREGTPLPGDSAHAWACVRSTCHRESGTSPRKAEGHHPP